MLPNISGFDICKKVRQEGIETPIIFLTARGEEIDKVLGLEFGADDYVTKPFSVITSYSIHYTKLYDLRDRCEPHRRARAGRHRSLFAPLV